MRNGRTSFVADVAKGIVAGGAGTWAMERVTGYLWEHQAEAARQRYEEVTGGRYPPSRMAERVNDLLHLGLSEDQQPRLAQTLHWVYGLGAGVGYSLLRHRIPGVGAGQGLLFGALFSLLGDEVFTAATGLAEPPRAYPWQAHARGFVGHLAFGLVADAVLNTLDRAA